MKKLIVVLKTVATMVIAIGIITILRKRAHKPSRLFLFRSKDFDGRYPADAAAALIGPNIFQIMKPFKGLQFDDWAVIWSGANGNKKWLLLIDYEGVFATALIDENFQFSIYQYYPTVNKVSAFSWSYVAVDGRGYLLLVDFSLRETVVVGFAQIFDDGSFVKFWETDVDIPLPYQIIGLPDAHAWMANDFPTGQGCNIYIFDVKHAQVLSNRRWEEQWEGMVNEKDILFLYGETKSETCLIDSNHQLITIRKTSYDKDIARHSFDRVASTPGAHLCWDYMASGWVQVHTLNMDGFKMSQRIKSSSEEDFWNYIVPC